jgi:ABC-type Mn2+/Zn2+ transport system permease subunit
VLFGTILAVDTASLVGIIAGATLLTLALIYRPLICECFDPDSGTMGVVARCSIFRSWWC